MISRISFAAILLVSTAVVFAVEVKWPVPPAGYASAANGIPKGTLSPSTNYPTTSNGNLPVRVYTPPGYSATRAEKYPVLYLHHGRGGNEHAWTSNNGHAEGYADKVMDFLYAQTDLKVTPMIVVMPNGRSVPTGGDETFGQFENILIKDLIPYIEKTYNASPEPIKRAIAGLSMGGGQTLNFGYKYPATFSWIGAFSPAPNTTPAGTTITNLPAVKSNIRLNFLAAGTKETGYLSTARTYHNWLNTNGVANLYLQVEENQDHVRENWNRQLHNFAQRIFKVDATHLIRTDSKKSSLSFHAGAGEERTASRFLVSRDGGAVGISIFSLDGRAVMQRPAALLSGTAAQP